MRVTVVRPNELGPDEAALWSTFQASTTATRNPFLSLTFARAVGRARSSARVAVIEQDGVIGGFLPFDLTRPGIAIPIGWPMNDLQGLVTSSGAPELRTVVKLAGLRVWRFDHLLSEQAARLPYRLPTFQSPVIDLSDGYQSYLTWLNGKSKVTAQTARKRRALERDLGSVALEWNSPRPEDFRRVIEWKTEQYRRTGGNELFGDPAALRIAEELAASSDDDCAGIVNVLRADGRPVAAHFGIATRNELSWWFPTYDPDLGQYSPGMTMLMAVTEESARRRMTRIDLGAGQQSYKLRVATGSYAVAKGAVHANRAEGAGRRAYRQMRQLGSRMQRTPSTGSH